jgi:ABC-2 type transport system ATP-binding protein
VQLIGVARALIHHPCLVLLDEPTTGLDDAGVVTLLDVVKELCARDAIVLSVSHSPELFRGLKHERVVLEGGRVVS